VKISDPFLTVVDSESFEHYIFVPSSTYISLVVSSAESVMSKFVCERVLTLPEL